MIKPTNEQIDEAAVAAVLVFKDNDGVTVSELEEIAEVVQRALRDHFAWRKE
jgi:hypothetical protein